jgi:carboxyl-terminal processing protease
MEQKKEFKNWVRFGILAILFFLGGTYVGFAHRPALTEINGIQNKDEGLVDDSDFDLFWKTWKLIDEKYPDASKVTSKERIWGAVKGLMGSLNDPYSVFFDPAEAKDFEDSVTGSFGGVGIEIGMKDKLLTVIAPLKDTPAYNAGVKAGDFILKIDGTTTADMSIDKAISLIRGKEGTSVTLTLMHEGDTEPRDVKIVRGKIEIPTLDTEARPDGIFVIKLYQFSENAPELFQKAVNAFKASKDTKMILDLRGDPGGYLDGAIDIASQFLPSGEKIVIEDYGGDKEQTIHRSKGYDIWDEKKDKMMILVDGGSASASEIVAGALSENGVAKLVGETTYGKGSVQELIDVTSDTALKITIAKWLTPNGVSISKQGLKPDYEVVPTEKDIAAKKDVQMEKAIELLK